MIHRNKIFINFATSNKDYPVHSSSGLGRRPLTAETRVRTPDALQEARSSFAGFSFSGYEQTCLVLIQVDHATSRFISITIY